MSEKEQISSSQILQMPIGTLMKKNYLDYAVSVIVDRALPDVRDGLKPVHRRILYAMYGLGMMPNTAFKKSARMVGETMGKYHPHGDSSIYEASMNMARPWAKVLPLIEGQGNIGSIDGDNAAAMRYTEMRLARAGAAFFDDIEKETIKFVDNYDGSEREPEVLPVSYPNILVNGVDGIAVGMATCVLPHNVNEVIDLTLAIQKNPNLTEEELLQIIPAPDFPTGGIVHNLTGYKEAVLTGRGAVKVRAKWHSEEYKGQDLLIIDELPYQVNKKELVEFISEKASVPVKDRDEDFAGIADIHDESNKEGIRIVITLKKEAMAAVVFNRLVKRTNVECSYNYNIMLLEGQVPKQMNFFQIINKFLEFRTEVIVNRLNFDLRKAKAKLHILSGLMVVLQDLDSTIKIIRENKDVKSASEALISFFNIDEIQTKAILEMRLQKLTGAEIDSIKLDYNQISAIVEDIIDTLDKPNRVQELVKIDLVNAKEKFGKPRLTEVSYENNELHMKDLIKNENCLIHITQDGYVKRTSLSYIETQNRKGKGRNGIQVSDGDNVAAIYSGSTHDMFIVFTKSGKALSNYVWTLPDGTMAGKGRHLRNIFENLDEKVASILLIPEIEDGSSIITVTENGKVKRTNLSNYKGTLRKRGVQGVGLEEGDSLVSVMLAKENDNLMLVATNGKATCFEIKDGALQERGRKSVGVRGIRLAEDAKVVSAIIIPDDMTKDGVEVPHYLLCVGENGVGKRTKIEEFTPHNRGGKGVNCFNINEKTGPIVMASIVTDNEDIVLTTNNKTIRIAASEIKVSGRITSGVILMDVKNDKIIDVIKVPKCEKEELLEDEEGSDINSDNGDTFITDEVL